MTRSYALVVDDTEECTIIGRRLLQGEGCEVLVASDGSTALEMARSYRPELVLLDVGLPDIDGHEVCRRLREFTDAYVVMLTLRDSETDRILGLGSGADDYVTKPFSVPELTLRIRAMRRRPRPRTDCVRTFGELQIDPLARETQVDGVHVELTRIEFDLLETLSGSPRRPFTRHALMQAIWGSNAYGDDHLVDVHMGNLRRKLRDCASDPRHLRTMRGVGYRFDP